MYAVGRIGSYISRGVYTVSGPFHPFGGAVDIIVVEQPDGSFKSSPWYVRFGKFQGVLKTREKVVSIDVNGVEADFHMYLDHKGEAYFLKEVDNEERESVVLYPSSSGDETDGQSSSNMRPMKSKSCNYDSDRLNFADQIDGSNEQILSRTDSRRAKILGLVFGRRSITEDDYREGKDGVVRLSSLERAEIAADLLEVKWSTNLASSRARKDYDSRFSSPDVLGEEMAKAKQVIAEHSQAESLVHDAEKNSINNSTLHKEIGSLDEQVANNSHSSSVILESSFQKASTEVLSIGTKEQVVETPKLGESILEEDCEMVSKISRRLDGFSVGNAYHDGCEEQTQPDSKIRCELEARDGKNFDKELACKEKDVAFPGCGISNESESDRVQSFVYCETSESSVVGPDDSNEQTQGLDSGGCREVHVHLETLHVTTELLPKDADNEFGKDPVEASRNHSDQMNAALCELDSNATDLEKPFIVQELSTQIVSVDPAHGSIKEVESQNICSAIHQSLASIGDSQKLFSDNVLEKVASNSLSEGAEEEQFLFSDLDESKVNELVDSSFPDCVKEVDHPLSCDEGNKEMNGSVNQTEELCSSPNMLVTDLENSKEESSVMSSPVDIPKNHMGGENVERLVESLPIIWSPTANLSADATQHPLSHSLDSNSKLLKWTWLSANDSGCMKSDADEEQQLAQEQPNTENTQISEELKGVLSSPEVGDTSKTIVSPGGSWRLWPFSLSRSSSRKDMQPALSDIKYSDAEIASQIINDIDGAKIVRKSAEIASKIINDMDGAKIVCKSKLGKKIIRSITPTSEQLASLNLKEGSNTITFRFFTPMLGKQQVDARVYLWKWNNRIVISDVDGTITKSDVLGQFMPLVGMDWSQTGVVHLFQAIKENGYRFLYLSARSITQAYHTRQFLFNLKQDGKALPEGPVVISPDGLFPSLFREVIRRAPHEFKISCLEDIRALFPSDCNPFYAGFGNRDTDEISYLKVGIPRGKIFTINPKGEIAVNRSVDTKSYTSLHAHVHGMFPTMTSSEQENFNSWNFWKLPPPDINN